MKNQDWHTSTPQDECCCAIGRLCHTWCIAPEPAVCHIQYYCRPNNTSSDFLYISVRIYRAQERDRLQSKLFGTSISRYSTSTHVPEPSSLPWSGTEGHPQSPQAQQQQPPTTKSSKCQGALSHSALWCSRSRQPGMEYTHAFHAMHLWETPVLPLDDPTLQTWRYAVSIWVHWALERVLDP